MDTSDSTSTSYQGFEPEEVRVFEPWENICSFLDIVPLERVSKLTKIVKS